MFLITSYRGTTVWHSCVRGTVFCLSCLRLYSSADFLRFAPFKNRRGHIAFFYRGNSKEVYDPNAYNRRLPFLLYAAVFVHICLVV